MLPLYFIVQSLLHLLVILPLSKSTTIWFPILSLLYVFSDTFYWHAANDNIIRKSKYHALLRLFHFAVIITFICTLLYVSVSVSPIWTCVWIVYFCLFGLKCIFNINYWPTIIPTKWIESFEHAFTWIALFIMISIHPNLF